MNDAPPAAPVPCKGENEGMLARPLPGRHTAAITIIAAALALGACAGGAPADPTHPARAHHADAPCGVQAQATIAAVDAAVTAHIYGNELAGREVNTDIAHVSTAADLIKAVAADDAAAAKAATALIRSAAVLT